jgi:hypothetical protein
MLVSRGITLCFVRGIPGIPIPVYLVYLVYLVYHGLPGLPGLPGFTVPGLPGLPVYQFTRTAVLGCCTWYYPWSLVPGSYYFEYLNMSVY